MGADKSKFGPELMGRVRMADRLSNFFSSLLDIGKSIRIGISKLVNPDYDAFKDIFQRRDEILGHTFNEFEQRAPDFSVKNVEKEESEGHDSLKDVNEIIEKLKDKIQGETEGRSMTVEKEVMSSDAKEEFEVVDTSGISVFGSESKSYVDSVTSSTVVEPDVSVHITADDTASAPYVPDGGREMFPQIKGGISVEVVDVVADVMSTIDNWIIDSGEIFEDIREYEIVSNVMSICAHDRIIEQMTIDDPSYGPFVDVPPVFNTVRPSQKQMTLDIETGDVVSEDVPWYTDADLISIGIQAATEDFIESNIELWETYEPVCDDVKEEADPEGYLIDMAVRAMSEDAIEQVIVRIARESRSVEGSIQDEVPQQSQEVSATEASGSFIAIAAAPELMAISASEPVMALQASPEVLAIGASESPMAIPAAPEVIAIPASEPVMALQAPSETIETEIPEQICQIADVAVSRDAEASYDATPATEDMSTIEVTDAEVVESPVHVQGGSSVRFCFGTGASCAGGSSVRFCFGVRSY